MRAVVWIAVASGCDGALGLVPTHSVDAQQFDAALVSVCPAFGTVPHFSTSPLQVVFRPTCGGYTTSRSTNTALALCTDGGFHIEQGSIDGPLAPTPLQSPVSNSFFFSVALGPDGDVALMLSIQRATGLAHLVRFRQANGAWDSGSVLAPPTGLVLDSGSAPSTPTRGSPRRFVIATNDGVLHELVDDDSGTLVTYATIASGALGPSNASVPMLSADGLRMLFHAGTLVNGTFVGSVYYADRSALDVPFEQAKAIPDVPNSFDPFLTENCDRLYFSGIGSIWYVDQTR